MAHPFWRRVDLVTAMWLSHGWRASGGVCFLPCPQYPVVISASDPFTKLDLRWLNTHIMTDFFKLVAELGLPIAATAGMGVFILFIIKYILNGIVNSIKFIESVIIQLDNRVKTMNNDIIKIDQEVSEQLGIPVDTDRIARADGKTDARKD